MRITKFTAIPTLLAFLLTTGFAQEENGADAQAVEEALVGLRNAHKEKLDKDQIHFIKVLATKWTAADAKQRKEIHDLADKSLKGKSQDVKEAMVESLAQMGGGEKDKDAERATKILSDEADKKTTEENISYFSQVVLAIGRVQHKKGADVLMKLLKYKDFDIVATAAQALGYYREADIDVKKNIVGELLKIYQSTSSQADDPRNTTAKQRLEKISPAMESALKSLSGQTEVTGADSWWRWWQDTGKKAKSW